MREKVKLLIVDDNVDFCEIIEDYLASDPDIEILGKAFNGQAAYDMIVGQLPDIVLLDLIMPVHDGIEVLKKMQTCNLARKPLFLILSANGETAYTDEAMRLGASGYIMKPVNLRFLANRIHMLRKQHE